MPAVANKVDKVASSDVNNNSTAGAELKKGKMDPGAATSDNSQVDPVKTAGQIIEKKVRNLEKRKARLLELKGEEDKGKQLQPEQKEAVKKLDNVIELVDTLKEIKKNVTDSLTDCYKQLKKQSKKEQSERSVERAKEEQDRLKLFVQGQFVLARLPECKQDLLIATDEAVKLSEKQFDALEKLSEIIAKADSGFADDSVEKLALFLDGSKKEFVSGLTGLEVKTVVRRLIDSKYFDSVPLAKQVTVIEKIVEVEKFVEPAKVVEEVQHPKPPQQPEIRQPVEIIAEQPQAPQQQQPVPISFLNGMENDLHKDPAVLAVASEGDILRPNGSPVFPSDHFYPPVSMNSIQSQTFTNQNFMGHPPFVPVSLVQVGESLAALRINPVATPAGVAAPTEKQIPQPQGVPQQQQQQAKRSAVDPASVSIPNALVENNKEQPSQPSETGPSKKVETNVNGSGGYNKRHPNGPRTGGGGGGPRSNIGNGPRGGGGGGYYRGGRNYGPKPSGGQFGGDGRRQDGGGAPAGGDSANAGGPRGGNFRSHPGGPGGNGMGPRAYPVGGPNKYGNHQPKQQQQQPPAGPQ